MTVFTNLLENGAEYANDGGRLWATGTADSEGVEIEIANTGCRLTAEQLSHVFDRFWRADSARQNTGVHCGLGLPLVRRISSALGSPAAAKVDRDGVFAVVVKLKRNWDSPDRMER